MSETRKLWDSPLSGRVELFYPDGRTAGKMTGIVEHIDWESDYIANTLEYKMVFSETSINTEHDWRTSAIPTVIRCDDTAFLSGGAPFSEHVIKPRRIVRNGPAMVVFWNDGTKTVVKCHEEEFDFEKGLAMALARKMWGRSRTLAYLKKVEEQATSKGGSCEVRRLRQLRPRTA